MVEVFEPASERGQAGLTELQTQTVNLLSFKPLPKDVYDAQVGFNLLARFGEESVHSLEDVEARIDRHLATLLLISTRMPMPSLRLVQAPVFHGYSCSVWIEFATAPGVDVLEEAIASAQIEVRRTEEEPPNNVGVAGEGGIECGRNSRGPQSSTRVLVLAGRGQSTAHGGDGGRGGEGIAVRWLLSLGALLFATSCGYHVSGKADLMPKTLHTIAIPAFGNATIRYKLTDRIPEALAREFITRTRYKIVQDEDQADMILRGTVVNYFAYPIVFDPSSSRASVVQISVVMSATLTERATGKVLFTRPTFEVKQQYEISSDQLAFFEESDTAMQRLSRDVARMLVSAVLENFYMTPDQFLRQVQKGPAEVYLFLGPDGYHRDLCRKALVAAALAPEEREEGYIRHDLDNLTLAEVLDDARSMSLFASRRVIWVSGAESALPRGRMVAAPDDEEGESGGSPTAMLAAYIADPVPGTVLVFEPSRYEFDGEDKARIERVQKYYAAIPNQVEFRPFTPEAARGLAQDLARQANLKIGNAEIGLLVEALGADASRIAAEIEKLALFAGTERKVTPLDISKLVPNAQETTIFELVAALGAGNRARCHSARYARSRGRVSATRVELSCRSVSHGAGSARRSRPEECGGHPEPLHAAWSSHLA